MYRNKLFSYIFDHVHLLGCYFHFVRHLKSWSVPSILKTYLLFCHFFSTYSIYYCWSFCFCGFLALFSFRFRTLENELFWLKLSLLANYSLLTFEKIHTTIWKIEQVNWFKYASNGFIEHSVISFLLIALNKNSHFIDKNW